MTNYQICTNCVMDTSDPSITFNDQGECKYCDNFSAVILPDWEHSRKIGLSEISQKINAYGKNKEFDCIIGLSGGLDSSYLTHVAVKEMGLRPLLFHVDAGWNSNQAVSNIEKLVDGLGLDLYTEVINWEGMKDLHRAFFKSQIADQDIPQDAVFFSAMYRFARKNRIKYVLTGSNHSLECVREPEEWGGYLGIDRRLITAIHRKFGERANIDVPIIDILVYRFVYRWLQGMRVVSPLNMTSFIKKDAESLLNSLYGWEPFQHKHHESRFTRFYEDYWLPKKFGFQKRRAHFSSMILTGQMARETAIVRLESPELSEETLNREFEYVADKLEFSPSELTDIFTGVNKTWSDYPNKHGIIDLGRRIYRMLGLDTRTVK